MKNYENFARFRRDPNSKFHFSSFCPNWPLGPVKIPVLEAFLPSSFCVSVSVFCLPTFFVHCLCSVLLWKGESWGLLCLQ